MVRRPTPALRQSAEGGDDERVPQHVDGRVDGAIGEEEPRRDDFHRVVFSPTGESGKGTEQKQAATTGELHANEDEYRRERVHLAKEAQLLDSHRRRPHLAAAVAEHLSTRTTMWHGLMCDREECIIVVVVVVVITMSSLS